MTVDIIDITPPTIEAQLVVVGPRGPAGGGAVVYPVSVASATWTLTHNLGRLPMINVYVAGAQVDADIDVTTTHAVITFAAPATGYAVIS